MLGKELLIVMRRRTLPVIGQISKYAVLFSCICRKRQGLRFLCEMNAFPWKLDGMWAERRIASAFCIRRKGFSAPLCPFRTNAEDRFFLFFHYNCSSFLFITPIWNSEIATITTKKITAFALWKPNCPPSIPFL